MSENIDNQQTDGWLDFETEVNSLDSSEHRAESVSGSSVSPDKIEQVKETIEDKFDSRSWNVTEAVLSVHATHFLAGTKACIGLIIEGPSGCGKTTCLLPLEGLHDQFYRSDDITPASFVSHDSSKTEDELQEQDLLPRIKNKTVLNPEMANWFSGNYSTRKSKMSRMVRVMDGDGLVTDSGTHGQRGYEGEYPFNFIGATTPLDSDDWNIMGHTGNRFLFHEMPPNEDSDAIREAVFGDIEYEQKIEAVDDVVCDFLDNLWQVHDGSGGVTWSNETSDLIQDHILYLAELIRYARSPLNENEEPEREDPTRISAMLRDLARGHALLYGRTSLQIDDLAVCSRVALSTMPHRRRGLIREILQLDPQDHLKTSDVEACLGVSKPTAQDRMEMIANLEIGRIENKTVQGGEAQVISINPEFSWPDNLEFPDLRYIN